MSAPIGRVRIKTSERKRRAVSSGRWRPTEPPVESEARGHEELEAESAHPPFYPFPLRDDGER